MISESWLCRVGASSLVFTFFGILIMKQHHHKWAIFLLVRDLLPFAGSVGLLANTIGEK